MPQTTLTAHPHSFPPRLTRAQWQELLAYLFASTLLLLLMMAAGVTYHYMTPQLHWVKVGNVAQFSMDPPTRVDINTAIVYVVNHGDGFSVLHAIANDYSQCGIYWEEWREALADPCRGTLYTLAGNYALNGPPPYRALDRYTTRLEANGDLYIEITKPILGITTEQMQKACIKGDRRPTWYLEKYWNMFCNLENLDRDIRLSERPDQ